MVLNLNKLRLPIEVVDVGEGTQKMQLSFNALKLSAGAVFAAIVKGAKECLDAYEKVDGTMRLMNETMGNTEAQAKQMWNTMSEAAKNSVYSMEDASQAMLNFARAGLEAEEAASALAPAMSLAAGEGGNLDTVSAGLVSTINGFQDSFNKTAKYADIFAAACNNSALDIDSLSSNMNTAAPVFESAGYNVEDLTLALGLMGNKGIDASKSANALKTGLARLVAPTDAAAAVMSRLNISMTDEQGNMKGFEQMLGELSEAFSHLSEEESIQAASTLFGKNTFSQWLALIQTAPSDVNALSDAIHNSAGTADAMAKTMMDGYAGAKAQLESTLDVFKTDVGQALAPAGEAFLRFSTEVVEALDKIVTAEQEVTKYAGETAALLSPGEDVLGKTESVLNAVGKDTSSVSDRLAARSAEIESVVALQEQIINLSNIENRTKSQTAQLAQAINTYNNKTGSSIRFIGEQNEVLSVTEETLRNNTELWKSSSVDIESNAQDLELLTSDYKALEKQINDVKKVQVDATLQQEATAEAAGKARDAYVDAFNAYDSMSGEMLNVSQEQADVVERNSEFTRQQQESEEQLDELEQRRKENVKARVELIMEAAAAHDYEADADTRFAKTVQANTGANIANLQSWLDVVKASVDDEEYKEAKNELEEGILSQGQGFAGVTQEQWDSSFTQKDFREYMDAQDQTISLNKDKEEVLNLVNDALIEEGKSSAESADKTKEYNDAAIDLLTTQDGLAKSILNGKLSMDQFIEMVKKQTETNSTTASVATTFRSNWEESLETVIEYWKRANVQVQLYNQAVAGLVVPNGMPSDVYNKYFHKERTGLSYVPEDGFIAELHKGERVLTASENDRYSAGMTNGQTISQTFNITVPNKPTPMETAEAIRESARREAFGFV